MRYVIVEEGIVTNVVIWDGESEYSGSEALVQILGEEPVGIGWSYSGGHFTAPTPEEEEVIPEVDNSIKIQSADGTWWRMGVNDAGITIWNQVT